MNNELERLKELAGIETVNERYVLDKDYEIEKMVFPQKPANMFDLKAVELTDDTFETTKKNTGQDELQAEKIKVPASVKKSITTRKKELQDSMETYGGGGPAETALDQLEQFEKLLSSGTVADYRQAQLLYGTLWNEIQERLPTPLVSFLHTGKELENTPVQ